MNTAGREFLDIEARLNALDYERCLLLERKKGLLDSRSAALQPIMVVREVLSPPQKIDLFSRLFKGREDIFRVELGEPARAQRIYRGLCE